MRNRISSTTTKDFIPTRSRLDQRKVPLGSTVVQQPEGKNVRQSRGEIQRTSCETQQRRTRNLSSTPWISSRFINYYMKNGRPHGHRYGKKGITSTSSRISSRRNVRRNFLGIHDRFIRDERFRKNMIQLGRSEEMCREMDKLANEDHTHHITAREIRVYRNNWWLRSNTVGSDTMPVRHRADFKQALSTLRQLKHHEDTAHQQR